MSARTSGSAFCRRTGCGSRLVDRVDRIGRVAFVCELCERNAKRLCRDCPRRLTNPKSLRCEPCRAEHNRQLRAARSKESYSRRRESVLAQKREYQKRPDVRERTLARLAAYRATHPVERDDQLRAYHRTWMRDRRNDPQWRERINARRREIARLKREGTWRAAA